MTDICRPADGAEYGSPHWIDRDGTPEVFFWMSGWWQQRGLTYWLPEHLPWKIHKYLGPATPPSSPPPIAGDARRKGIEECIAIIRKDRASLYEWDPKQNLLKAIEDAFCTLIGVEMPQEAK